MDNVLKLVRLLGNNLADVMSIRQLALDTYIPYTSTLRTIKEHADLFSIKRRGNASLISLNYENSMVKHYLIIAERQTAKEVFEQQPVLKKVEHDLKPGRYALVLFGSRAKGQQRNQSDIDLCIISKKGEKVISFSKFEMLSGKEVNPIYFSDKEFIEMIKNKEHNVGKEIVGKHIVLYGEEYYWELVWPHVI